MSKQLIMGVFDSEKFWRDENASSLPGIYDNSSANIINVMDELLFPLCIKNDILITRKIMNESHKNYLDRIGFSFFCNSTDLDYVCATIGNTGENIFEFVSKQDNFPELKKLIDADTYLSPYAVIPFTHKMCDAHNIHYSLPELEYIKVVNSKIYSNTLKEKLGLNAIGEIVYDSEQLILKGLELLKKGSFLIKDEYGVSGKGNILITSEKMLLRMAVYLKKQEDNQKNTRFVIEPFLDKLVDFSCNVVLDSNGSINITGVQKIINNSFNYAGTCSIEKDLYKDIEKKGYFAIIEKVAEELYKDGYFGDIGIDSMILKDGSIIPVIEINARKTMGMINQCINKYLERFNIDSQLALYSLGYNQPFEYEILLSKMKEYKILFEPGAEEGIIPLSANTLLINSVDKNNISETFPASYKGRFYYSAAAKTEEEKLELIKRTGELFKSLGFKIY